MVADTHAHNDYLELLAEAGVIGFALCLLLAARPVATALRASLRGEPSPDSDVALACVASLAAILAHSLVDFNLRIPANGMVFFWLLGMCRACGDALEPTRSGG
jgi:O-antigen ligase